MATTTRKATPKADPVPVLGQSPSIKNVLKAINAVMKEVGYVEKTKSSNLPYTFASEAALIQALRPAMVEKGLVLWVSSVKTSADERFEAKNNRMLNRSKTTAKMRIGHVTTGEWIEVMAQGEGIDAGDKATPKALTGFYKYALRQTFMIEAGDDPDFQSSDEQERAPDKAKKKSNNQPEYADNKAIGAYAELLKVAKSAKVTLPEELILDWSQPISLKDLRENYRQVSALIEETKEPA
jgi:hypothetical protein